MTRNNLQQNSGPPLPGTREELRHFNLGIFIIGAYYALEFGSLQGLYPLINSLKIPTIVIGSALLYAVYLLLTGRITADGITICYFFFCSYLMINISFLTISPENSENQLKLLIGYLAYYTIAMGTIQTFDAFVLLLDILLACMAYSCLHGMLQGGLLWGSQWLSDENIYAVFCCTGIAFPFVLLSKCRSRLKDAGYMGVLFLYVVGVALAASRGGFLAFASIFFVFWWFGKKKIRGIVFIALFLTASLSMVPPKVYQELEQISVDEQKDNVGERQYLWRLGMEMFNDHKMAGIGLGNFGEQFSEYDQRAEARDQLYGVTWRGQKWVAHSTPVTILAEAGIVGTLLLLFLLFIVFKALRQVCLQSDDVMQRNFAIAIMASIVSFWVGASFLSLTVYPFFYNIILMSGVFLKLCKKTPSDTNSGTLD